jgi:hypothetical protein
LSLGNLDTNPDKETVQLAVQVIVHEDAVKIKALPIDKVLTVAKSQFKSKIHVQALDTAFTLIRLDVSETFDIDPVKIREQMTKAIAANQARLKRCPAKKEKIRLWICMWSRFRYI